MGFIRIVLSLLCLLSAVRGYADILVEPNTQIASAGFFSENASVLWIAVGLGIIILLIVAFLMRKK